VVATLGALGASGGCASKGDLRNVQNQIAALEARQDSLFRLLQRQNRELLDSLHANSELTTRMRGEVQHNLLQLGQQLVQVQELTGQSQARIQQIRDQLETQQREAAAAAAAAAQPAADSGRSSGGTPGTSADQLYQIGREQLQRGSAGTARKAFEQLLHDYPSDERAPEAQFSLAETYVVERQFDRALDEFGRVVELFPSSAQAPTALYRAGVISEERGNNTKAREYYQRVSARYPKSDEARLAADKLRRLRR
jgi:tol-pal system protein YbgF